MQKRNQQSRSGWGGKRTGAGAPVGNTNAVTHGERSRRAFRYCAGGFEDCLPMIALRARNLIIAERVGELLRDYPLPGTERWRELMLLDGIMWQHTRQMVRLEKEQTREMEEEAKTGYLLASTEYECAQVIQQQHFSNCDSQKKTANKTANSRIAKSNKASNDGLSGDNCESGKIAKPSNTKRNSQCVPTRR